MNKHLKKTNLIVAILILLSMAGSLQAKGGKKHNNKQRGVWMTEMNLNSQQLKKINQLRDEMQPAIMSIRHNTRTMELELDRLNRSEDSASKRVAALRQSIRANNQSISALQRNQKVQIRLLLTPEQQSIYDTYGKRMTAADKRGNSRGNCIDRSNNQGQGRRNRG